MGLICKAFGHKWDGCKCRRCGEMRNEQHDWDGCKCRRCGKTKKTVKSICEQCDGTGHLTCSEPCSFCHGSGAEGWSTAYNVPVECRYCAGTRVEKKQYVQKPCPHCGGTGKIDTIVIE